MILMLSDYTSNIEVIYVPGNHDEYVGWHIINWLKVYFRDKDNITFDQGTKNTKCTKYGKSGIMFNHGDAIKPEKLAGMFPILFKDEWSSCNDYYIFTGDKHHEKSQDINGIKFYQLPALSSAKSLWDDKNGYICTKAEITGFMIDEQIGLTNIFKQAI